MFFFQKIHVVSLNSWFNANAVWFNANAICSWWKFINDKRSSYSLVEEGTSNEPLAYCVTGAIMEVPGMLGTQAALVSLLH